LRQGLGSGKIFHSGIRSKFPFAKKISPGDWGENFSLAALGKDF
jgi:hypothetical protein